MKRKYDEIQEQIRELRASRLTTAAERVIQALQTRSDDDATAILQRLRAGTDVESILRLLEGGDLLLQLQVVPETRYRFTFPFRSELPVPLQSPDNPYLRATLYQAVYQPPGPCEPSQSSGHDQVHPQYLKPYSAATIVDPRLDLVKPSTWTQVSTNDDLMRTLLRDYFQYEYPFLVFFHKDLFLADMVSGKTRYCSSLLVNVVLAHACVSLVLWSQLLL